MGFRGRYTVLFGVLLHSGGQKFILHCFDTTMYIVHVNETTWFYIKIVVFENYRHVRPIIEFEYR